MTGAPVSGVLACTSQGAFTYWCTSSHLRGLVEAELGTLNPTQGGLDRLTRPPHVYLRQHLRGTKLFTVALCPLKSAQQSG